MEITQTSAKQPDKPRAYVFVDLGFGDSGKGASIDAFCAKNGVKTVIKYNSGPQSAHNVHLQNGFHHTFSQYGSGTLSGAKTFLSEFFSVDIIALINEGEALKSKGVNIQSKMLVHHNCAIITPFHIAINQIKESVRGDKKHGSCGMGHGELTQTIVDRRDFVLRVSDLFSRARTYNKLRKIQQYARDCIEKIGGVGTLKFGDHLAEPLKVIYDNSSVLTILSWYDDFINTASVAYDYEPYLQSDVVFEGGQGFLLDENYGFAPHTTWTDTTYRNALKILKYGNFKGEIVKIGITRTFATRHGDGPLPSYCAELSKQLSDPNNPTNTWQGKMRFGNYDFVTAAYAAKKLGKLDWLFVTHCDFLSSARKLKVCIGYETTNYHQMHVIPLDKTGRTNRLEIVNAKPANISIDSHLLKENISALFGAKIVCSSFGPNREDRIWHK